MVDLSALPLEDGSLKYGDRNRREAWVDKEPTSRAFAETLTAVDIATLGAMSITEHDEGECEFCDTVRAEVVRRLEEDDDADNGMGGDTGQEGPRRDGTPPVGFRGGGDR